MADDSGRSPGDADRGGREPNGEAHRLAGALRWAYVVMSVSMEMVVPAVVGYLIDGWIGTGWLFLAAGALLGMAVAMFHLLRIAKMGRD